MSFVGGGGIEGGYGGIEGGYGGIEGGDGCCDGDAACSDCGDDDCYISSGDDGVTCNM